MYNFRGRRSCYYPLEVGLKLLIVGEEIGDGKEKLLGGKEVRAAARW